MPSKKTIPLGQLTTVHHAQALRWRDLLSTFIPLGLVVLSPLGYGVWRSYYGYTHFGLAAAESWGRPWFLVSAIVALPLLLYALRRLRRAHLWVAVHAHGIRVHRPPGRVQAIPWGQVEGLSTSLTHNTFLGWKSQTRHSLTIYAINQAPIRLDDRLPRLPGLIASLKAHVYPRLRPQIRQAHKAGKALYFGPLKISEQGLDYKEKKLFWRDIDQVTIHKGCLQIHPHLVKAIRIPTKKILNIELLIELLE